MLRCIAWGQSDVATRNPSLPSRLVGGGLAARIAVRVTSGISIHEPAHRKCKLVAVGTFFVGVQNGVGTIYLQTANNCHSRYGWAGLHTSKLPVTAAHLLNNDVLPTFEAHDAKIDAVLSDNGRELCGWPDRQPYELFHQLEDIEHRTTRVKRPQSNGIVERFHRTLLDEHFRVEGRKTWFETVEEMQAVLDAYLVAHNTKRPHQGCGRQGRTPVTSFGEGLPRRAKRDTPAAAASTKLWTEKTNPESSAQTPAA